MVTWKADVGEYDVNIWSNQLRKVMIKREKGVITFTTALRLVR